MFSGKTRDSTDKSWESNNKTGECVSKIERKVGSLEILRETSSTTSLERQNSIYLGSWGVSPFVTHAGSSCHWDQQQARANGVLNLFVNPSNYGYSKNFVELIVHSKMIGCTLDVLVGGWATPLKNISQLGLFFPIYGKIKNVPNHQPVFKGSAWFSTLFFSNGGGGRSQFRRALAVFAHSARGSSAGTELVGWWLNHETLRRSIEI